MANFTEIATLKLNDRSSANVRKIAKALTDLRSATKRMQAAAKSGKIIPEIEISNMRAASRSMDAYSKKINKIADAQKSLNSAMKISGAGARGGIAGQLGTAQAIRDLNRIKGLLASTRADTRRIGGIDRRFPRNIGAAFNRVLGYDSAYAARSALRTGGRSVVDTSNARFIEYVRNFSDEDIEEINSASTKVSSQLLLNDPTSLRVTARTLRAALNDGEDLAEALKSVSIGSTALTFMKSAEAGERFGETITKLIDRAGYGKTAREVAAIAEALSRAQLVAEKDLNPHQVLTAVQRLGSYAQGFNAMAFYDLAMDVDAGKGQAARNINTFMNNLLQPSLAKKYKKSLTDAGIGQGANVVDPELLRANPFDWINKYLRPLLEKRGVDLNSAANVGAELSKVGFRGEGINYAVMQILQYEERLRDRAQGQKIKLERMMKAANKSIQGAGFAVAAQWKNLTSTATDSLDHLAPYIAGYAQSMGNLADDIRAVQEGKKGYSDLLTLSNAKLAGTAAGVAAGGFVVNHPQIVMLGAAALRLNSAATKLMAAAGMQSTRIGPLGPAGGVPTAGKRGAGKLLKKAGIVGGVILGGELLYNRYKEPTEEEANRAALFRFDNKAQAGLTALADTTLVNLDAATFGLTTRLNELAFGVDHATKVMELARTRYSTPGAYSNSEPGRRKRLETEIGWKKEELADLKIQQQMGVNNGRRPGEFKGQIDKLNAEISGLNTELASIIARDISVKEPNAINKALSTIPLPPERPSIPLPPERPETFQEKIDRINKEYDPAKIIQNAITEINNAIELDVKNAEAAGTAMGLAFVRTVNASLRLPDIGWGINISSEKPTDTGDMFGGD